MTISAGFSCTDGILICADMQPTIEKNRAVEKIQRRTVPGLCEYIITGCGTGSAIVKAADMLQEALSASRQLIECQSEVTRSVVFWEIFRRRLKEIHSDISGDMGVRDYREKCLQWIIALNSFDSELSLLYIPETGEIEGIAQGGGGIILGYGAAIAYGFCRILWNASLPISQMRVLATFALYEAREPTWRNWCDSSYLVTLEGSPGSTFDDAYLATFVEEAMRFVLLRCRAKNVRQEDLYDGCWPICECQRALS